MRKVDDNMQSSLEKNIIHKLKYGKYIGIQKRKCRDRDS